MFAQLQKLAATTLAHAEAAKNIKIAAEKIDKILAILFDKITREVRVFYLPIDSGVFACYNCKRGDKLWNKKN